MSIPSIGRIRAASAAALGVSRFPRAHRADLFSVNRAMLCAYASCFALLLVLLPFAAPVDWAQVGPALAIQAAVGVLLILDERLDGAWQTTAGIIAVIAYLTSVALLRDGAAPSAGFGPLALLPVTWTTLRGRRAEFAVATVGIAAVYLVPAALIGAPHYPAGSWRAGIVFPAIAAVLGAAKLHLVNRVDDLMQRLEQLARTDDLTGLPNRRAWRELLDRALASARRTGQPLVVLLVDLDTFKQYNDTHGHPAGDRLLTHVASAWHGIMRDIDALVRWGGDEFAVLLPDCDDHQAEQVIERMCAVCPDVRLCVGLAQWDQRVSADALVGQADDQLYRAKRSRRSQPLPAAS
ncbi:MAG: GGDEF domain-containing protein [Solirubrobacteraceae bacterium]